MTWSLGERDQEIETYSLDLLKTTVGLFSPCLLFSIQNNNLYTFDQCRSITNRVESNSIIVIRALVFYLGLGQININPGMDLSGKASEF